MHVIDQYLKKASQLIFGFPCRLTPLRRREFLKAALFVLSVRYAAFICLEYLVSVFAQHAPPTAVTELWLWFLILVIPGVFFIPYFLTIYRRLLSLAAPFPCLLAIAAALGLTAFFCALADSLSLGGSALEGMILFAAIYLLLIPWPDRESHLGHSKALLWQQRVKAFICFFFGLVNLNMPLTRSAFIKSALGVIIIRGAVFLCLSYALLAYQESVPESDFITMVILLIFLLIVAFFYIPYFVVMHRRLWGLGVAYPGFITGLAVAIVCVAIFYLSIAHGGESALLEAALVVGLYLLLLPWPDRLKQDNS